jgi:hypothetical protein
MNLLKVIWVISQYPGSGQITVAVNLASGLVRKGYRVAVGDFGHSNKLSNWLGISRAQDQAPDLQETANFMGSNILSTRIGIDWLNMSTGPESSQEALVKLLPVEYDYLLLSAIQEDFKLLKSLPGLVIACTDLSHDNELAELQELDKCLQITTGKTNNIDLILPNKINAKEWDHNSKQLFTLGDYFGYETIADLVPG